MFARGCALTVTWSLSSLWRTRPAAVSCEVNRVLLYTVNSWLFMGDYLRCGLSVPGAEKLFAVLLLDCAAACCGLCCPGSPALWVHHPWAHASVLHHHHMLLKSNLHVTGVIALLLCLDLKFLSGSVIDDRNNITCFLLAIWQHRSVQRWKQPIQ